MPNVQELAFPVVEDCLTLWRSIVNDTFPGIAGTQGRIASDNAPFTLPFLNSALRTIQRKLRIEGVTFPIVDGFILNAIPPVVKPDPSVFVNVGYAGTNNGTTSFATPYLPGNLLQPYVVRQRVTGSNLQFADMIQAQQGLPSSYQTQWLGMWEWRGYAIWMNGSIQTQDLMIRYQSGQPPINAPASAFPTTPINIIDCQDAVAYLMAVSYGMARGGNPQQISAAQTKADEAINDMAEEYIRRAQGISYQRESYQGGGSNNEQTTSAGGTNVGE